MPSHRGRSRAEYAHRRQQRACQQPSPRERLLVGLGGQTSAHVQAGAESIGGREVADLGSRTEAAMKAQAAAQIRAERRT
eukprot:1537488-Pleurochrysis_carterae.AAC.1